MDRSDTPDEGPEPRPSDARASGPRPRRRRLDRRTLAICTCLALIAAIAAALVANALIDDEDGAGRAEGAAAMTLIDFDAVQAAAMRTVDGADTTLADELGAKPLLVNLWASNCAPCIQELPLLEQAAGDNPDVDFLGIDVLDRLDKARAMADKAGITYRWIQDPQGDFANAMQTTTLPTTFLFAPDGALLASKTEKAFADRAELQEWIDAAA